MDPVSTASAAAKVIPLAATEQRKLMRRNEVQNLFRAVPRALKGDHRVPAGHKRKVMNGLRGVRVDPQVGGCLKCLLEGDSSVLPVLEQRASELLRFDAEVDDRAVVVAFMEAVRANVIPAKRDVPGALSTMYREQLHTGEVLGEIREQVEKSSLEAEASERRVIEEIRSTHAGGAAFSLITGGRAFSPQTPKVLKELAQADRTVAQELGTVLADGGASALASWSRENTARLREMGVQATVHVGRLLMAEDQFEAAERLFVIGAENDSEDSARQLVRAANAALQDGRPTRSDELLDHARAAADPAHPALALAEIQHGDLSPAEVLERLDGVEAVTDADRLGLAATVAQAHLIAEEFEAADQALRDAERIDPEEPRVRELRAIWRLQRAHVAVLDHREVDRDDLEVAESGFLELREDMRRRGRHGDSGAMLTRAIDVCLLAKRLDRATELLDQASEEERHGSARLGLARQALLCGRGDLALELARAGAGSELARVIEASVNIDADAMETRQDALDVLDQLLFSEDPEIRAEAALARAVAALGPRDPAEWSARAGEVLAERDRSAAEIMRARAHLARGEYEQGEAVLRRHTENPEALNALVDAAAMQGEYERALQRSDALLRIRPNAGARFQHARLLHAAKRPVEALRELSDVARSPDALLPSERESAFREAVEVARTLKGYSEMESLCSDAIAGGASDPAFHWARASARFMLSRHKEALADLDAARLQPGTLAEAELLSRILYQSATPEEALRRNVQLSERFGKPERLEALLIAFSPRAGELDPETAAAIGKTYETFPERFPDSVMIQQREIPQTEDGILKLLADMAPPADRDLEIVEGIMQGMMVSAALAAFHSRSVCELWAALAVLPISYGDRTLEELELQDARDALAGPAVLDPTSLSVLALLGGDVERAVLRALPGSLIAQATLEDADRGVNPLNDPAAPVGAVIRHPQTGEPGLVATDAAQAARRAERQREHLRLARTLEAEPDAVPGGEDEMERALADEDPERINAALRTWAATITVAARCRLAVLSDDRRVRLSVRGEGLPSFGTLSLLRALLDAGDLDESVFLEARARLLKQGSLGLGPTGEELAGLARELDWEPAAHMYRLLSDPALWTPDASGVWGGPRVFLTTVWEEAPAKLAPWVARVLDAAKQAKPHLEIDVLCFGLLATAWGWTSPDAEPNREFLQAVIEVVRELPRYLGEATSVDPVDYALERFAAVSVRAPEAQRAIFALRAIGRLKMTDQLRAIERLWRQGGEAGKP